MVLEQLQSDPTNGTLIMKKQMHAKKKTTIHGSLKLSYPPIQPWVPSPKMFLDINLCKKNRIKTVLCQLVLVFAHLKRQLYTATNGATLYLNSIGLSIASSGLANMSHYFTLPKMLLVAESLVFEHLIFFVMHNIKMTNAASSFSTTSSSRLSWLEQCVDRQK